MTFWFRFVDGAFSGQFMAKGYLFRCKRPRAISLDESSTLMPVVS